VQRGCGLLLCRQGVLDEGAVRRLVALGRAAAGPGAAGVGRMKVIILVTVYRPQLDAIETAFVTQNMKMLAGFDGAWVMPETLDASAYEQMAPHFRVERFPAAFFRGIDGYNRLMLSSGFYERFNAHDFALICQTDALVLRNNLRDFLSAGTHYIGAPLPDTVLPRYYFPGSGHLMRALPWLIPSVKPRVGNGGLSLRSIPAFQRLLQQDALRLKLWRLYEDLYFSCRACDPASGFLAADVATARRFCVETEAGDWLLDPQKRPFGLHKPQAYAPRALSKLLLEFGHPDAAVEVLRSLPATPGKVVARA